MLVDMIVLTSVLCEACEMFIYVYVPLELSSRPSLLGVSAWCPFKQCHLGNLWFSWEIQCSCAQLEGTSYLI